MTLGGATVEVLNNPAKKYSVTIPRLFETILKLNPEQQNKVLKYVEELFVEDNRKSVRKACHITLNYATHNRIYLDHIKDISESGVFIETDRPLTVGEQITMSFNIQDSSRPFKLKGKIVRSNRLGVGVVFKDISPYIAQIIGVLVDRMKAELIN